MIIDHEMKAIDHELSFNLKLIKLHRFQPDFLFRLNFSPAANKYNNNNNKDNNNFLKWSRSRYQLQSSCSRYQGRHATLLSTKKWGEALRDDPVNEGDHGYV